MKTGDFMSDLQKYLFSENEIVHSILGLSYLNSFLSGQGLSKTVMILTDKRVYASGKSISLGRGSRKVELDANLHDISGSTIIRSSHNVLRVILSLFFAIILLGCGIAVKNSYGDEFYIALLCAALSILCLILVQVFLRAKLFLNIVVSGCEYGFPIKNCSDRELMSFRRKLAVNIEACREVKTFEKLDFAQENE